MTSLDAWLAAMPPAEEVEERIKRLEGELALLTTLLDAPRYDAASTTNGHNGDGHVDADESDEPTRRMSPERLAIARAIFNAPRRKSRPRYVTKELRAQGKEVEDRNVQVTMQRMAHAGQLLRIGTGIYALPPHIAAIIEAEQSNGRLLEVASP